MPNSPLIAVLVHEPVTRERLLEQLRTAGYYVQSYLSSAPTAMISAARPDLITRARQVAAVVRPVRQLHEVLQLLEVR